MDGDTAQKRRPPEPPSRLNMDWAATRESHVPGPEKPSWQRGQLLRRLLLGATLRIGCRGSRLLVRGLFGMPADGQRDDVPQLGLLQ